MATDLDAADLVEPSPDHAPLRPGEHPGQCPLCRHRRPRVVTDREELTHRGDIGTGVEQQLRVAAPKLVELARQLLLQPRSEERAEQSVEPHLLLRRDHGRKVASPQPVEVSDGVLTTERDDGGPGDRLGDRGPQQQ